MSLAAKQEAAAFSPSSGTLPSDPSAFVGPCAEARRAFSPFARKDGVAREPFAKVACRVVKASSVASFVQVAFPSFAKDIVAWACLPFDQEPFVASFVVSPAYWLSEPSQPPFSSAFSSSEKCISSRKLPVL